MNEIMEFSGPTMDSREIAGLTGRKHKSVLKTIRNMLTELDLVALDGAANFESTFIDDTGHIQPCFKLPKRECLILAAGFNIKLRAAIIDRWAELESGKAVPLGVNPLSDADKALEYEISRRLRLINTVFGEVSNGVKVATALESQKVVAQRTGIELALPEYITQYQVEAKQLTFNENADAVFASKIAIGRNYITVSQISKDFYPLTSTDINAMLVNLGYLRKTGYSTYSVTNKGREFASTRTLLSGPNKGSENVTGWNLDDLRFWAPIEELLIAQRDIKKKQLAIKKHK